RAAGTRPGRHAGPRERASRRTPSAAGQRSNDPVVRTWAGRDEARIPSEGVWRARTRLRPDATRVTREGKRGVRASTGGGSAPRRERLPEVVPGARAADLDHVARRIGMGGGETQSR